MKHKIIQCSCTVPDHMIQFRWFPEDDEMYLEVQMTPQPFFKRMWIGLKYVFGIKNTDYHWQETVLSEKEVKRIARLCREFGKRDQNKQLLSKEE